jgi:iron-sulfur cluster assembly protein
MSITVTESAAKHIANTLDKRGNGIGLRVGVSKSGCSGFSYVLGFADEIGENDEIFEAHGVKVLVAKENLSYLEGLELDFVKEGLNQSFKFNNPNAKNACGCGTSFGV